MSDRVPVSLSPQAVATLCEMKQLMPDVTSTDFINRAIMAYAFINKERIDGTEFWGVDVNTSTMRIVEFS